MGIHYEQETVLTNNHIGWGRFQLPPVTTKLTVRRKKRNSVTCE